MKMNRLIKLLPVMFVASLALSACIQEDLESPDGGLTEGNFTIQLTPPTKTANDGFSTVWVAGDKVNVFHAKAGSSDFVNDGAFEYTSGSSFKGNLGENLENGQSYDWYVAYPYDEKMTTPKKMAISIPAVQTQSEDGKMDHLCGSLCPLAGKAKNIPGNDEIKLQMQHLVTVMKIKVTNYEKDECILSSVSFCHHAGNQNDITQRTQLCGRYNVDFSGDSPIYTQNGLIIENWGSNDITAPQITTKSGSANGGDNTRPVVILNTPVSLALNQSATVYLACLPFEIPNASILSIGMNENSGINQGIYGKNVTCEAGKINGVKQGSRQAPPLKSSLNFYHGKKNADGSYSLDNDGWWRCELPKGNDLKEVYDLNGTFDFLKLFTTFNTGDASITVIDSEHQNPTVKYYYEDFRACLTGSEWNGSTLNPNLNLIFPETDKNGVFVNVNAGYNVGNFNIFFCNPAPEKEEPVVDTESDMYDSYHGLVMCGYQGWHGTPGDGCAHNPEEPWPHYASVAQQPFIFEPGVLRNGIDFWPDVSDYEKTYAATGFTTRDGSTPQLYSSYDESTVDLHFQWMKEYSIDGVFMQRFVSQLTNKTAIQHSDKVLESAMTASNVHARAISIMYDMVGMENSTPSVIIEDARNLIAKYNLMDRNLGQRYYLYHNNKPLVGLVSVGQESAAYTIAQAKEVVDGLQELGFSVMLGVPAYWRSPGVGDCVDDDGITTLIKDVDIIMPWNVGVYHYDEEVNKALSFSEFLSDRFNDKKYGQRGDFSTAKNYKVEYCPLVFAGFSGRNIKPGQETFGRYGGNFFWKQVYEYKKAGATMLYVAMFDEIDEGTAIYKCLRNSEVPLNISDKTYYVVYENGAYYRSDTKVENLSGDNWCKSPEELNVPFQGIEDNLPSDHYLWLTGCAADVFKGKRENSPTLPTR